MKDRDHQSRGADPARSATGFPMHIDLHTPVPHGLASEIERRLFFVSSQIRDFALVTDQGGVVGLTLFTEGPVDRDALTTKVNSMIDDDVRRLWVTPDKSVWTSRHQGDPSTGVFEVLKKTGGVSEVGEGQVAIGEPLLSLFAYFDQAVKDVLAEDFSAREFRYPTLIRTKALETAGYTTSFPQHLMFVTRLHNDIDVYRAFQEARVDSAIDTSILESCGNVDYCLPPTMCYHTFQQHSGRSLSPDGLHVITSRGKSFRFEASYSTTLERLWDFTIREIVFLGARDEVFEARARFMHKIFDFVDDLGLSGFCEVGNDPFFSGADTSERIWSQRLQELKYELRLGIDPDRTIAVGSFNFHGDLFGRAFDISRAGEPIHSGCVGFGLERLVYSFLCHYGVDEKDWPARVRSGTAAVSGG